MRKILFLIIILYVNIIAFAGTLDSTIFSSNYERNLFTKYIQNNEFQLADFLLAIDYNGNSKTEFQNEFSKITGNLTKADFAAKPLKKQIKLIQNACNPYLKSEEVNACFNQTINGGHFNIETATALYCLILDYFKIDYQIVSSPTDLYLHIIKGDENANLKAKTQPRTVGPFTDETKFDYLKFLVNMGDITAEEFTSKSVGRLFDKYFSSEKQISQRQLVAIVYLRRVIDSYKFGNQFESMRMIEKALMLDLYNAYHTSFFNSIFQSIIDEQFRNQSFNGELLGKYLYYNKYNKAALEAASGIYGEIGKMLVMNSSKMDAFDRFEKEMRIWLPDTMKPNSLDFVYNYYGSYYYLVAGNNKKSLEMAYSAYKVDPINMNIRNITHDAFVRLMLEYGDNAPDFEEVDRYFNHFNFLFNHNYLIQVFVYNYLQIISDAIDEEENQLAYDLLDTMNYRLKYENAEPDSNLVTEAYSFIYDEWTDEQFRSFLLSAFSRGLKYYPQNSYIKKRVGEFKNGIFPESYKSTYNYYSSSTTTKVYKPKSSNRYTPEEYAEKFDEEFKGDWCGNYFYTYGKKDDKKRMVKEAKIQLSGKNSVVYTYEGKTIKGKWTLRAASKLIYFTPDNDKNNYLTFRVIKFTDTRIELRPYDKNKNLTTYVLIFDKCD